MSAGGNVALSSSGIKLAAELKAGTRILGLDLNRELCFRKVVSVNEIANEECFILTSRLGEAILTSANEVMTFGRPRLVKELCLQVYSGDLKVERIVVKMKRRPGRCDELGCVARVFEVIRASIGFSRIFVDSIDPLSASTVLECIVHQVGSEGFFLSSRRRSYHPLAASHSGGCRGFEVMNCLNGSPASSIHFSPLRQLRNLQASINGEKSEIVAQPKFSPLMIGVQIGSDVNLDRLRTISLVGPMACFSVECEMFFNPLLGGIPFC